MVAYESDTNTKEDVELQQFRTLVTSHEQCPNVSFYKVNFLTVISSEFMKYIHRWKKYRLKASIGLKHLLFITFKKIF